MSDVDRKKRSRIPFVCGVLLVTAGVFANVYVVYQRHQFAEQTLQYQVEISQLSEKIAANQEIMNSLPEKRKLITKLETELNATFLQLSKEEYQPGLPKELLPADSRFLYLCQWEQFRARPGGSGQLQYQNSGKRLPVLHGLVYIPDTSQHQLVINSRGKNDTQSPITEDVVKFAIRGPGWTRYGWQLEKQENGAWSLEAYCNDSTKSIELPKVQDIVHGGSFGQQRVLAEQNTAWQNGWQQMNRGLPVPESLETSWLIMLPIKYEFDNEFGRPSSLLGRHIFVALESDEPMIFPRNDYLQLQRNNDPRVDYMTLDTDSGNYVYEPGE